MKHTVLQPFKKLQLTATTLDWIAYLQLISNYAIYCLNRNRCSTMELTLYSTYQEDTILHVQWNSLNNYSLIGFPTVHTTTTLTLPPGHCPLMSSHWSCDIFL